MTAVATVQDATMRFRERTALDGITAAFEQDSITGLSAATAPAGRRSCSC
jgi:ABC-2 type transport system ATP-binding protein